MSIKGLFDILLNIDSFRNIDLFYQGLYYIQFSSYQETSTGKNQAVPYEVQSDLDSDVSLHSVVPPQINEESSSYCTKIFLIKYSEEVVKVHESAIFRIESCLNTNPDLFLEAELFFTDLGGDLSSEGVSKFIKNPLGSSFSKVGSCVFKCSNWKSGFSQFCPIFFTDTYASVANITVHTILLDFKFRNDDGDITDYTLISQCLFPFCGRKVQDDNIDRVFKDFVISLSNSYNNACSVLNKVSNSVTKLKRKRKKLEIKPPLTIEGSLPISKCIRTRNKKKITKVLMKEIKEVASFVFQLRHDLSNFIKVNSTDICRHLEEKYHDKIKNLSFEHMYREVQIGELSIVSDSNPSQYRTARAHRRSLHSSKRDILEAYNVSIFAPEKLAVFFEEINIRSGQVPDSWNPKWFCSQKFTSEKHLFVLVHGYMGSAYDLKALKDVMMLYNQNLVVLVSESNEKHTEGSIQDMGQRLAHEVQSYISTLPEHIKLTRLSFIGHSLGGIIIRAALPYLQEFNKIMYSYFSFASPHLGCSTFSNKIVEAGLWIISKIKNSLCIQQLTLRDSLNPRKSLLYEMAKESKLGVFEKIVLVSSTQDDYVPFESARIEIKMENPDTIQLEMADCLALGVKELYRINVDFPIKPTLISNIHGRAAHISLLDSSSFLNILLYRFAEFLNCR